MKTIDDWMRVKLLNGYYCLHHPARASWVVHNETDTYKTFAKVRLFAEPANRFRYVSSVKWRDSMKSWGDMFILQGILDEMFTSNMIPTLGARVVLEECEYNDEAYDLTNLYWAARKATGIILKSGSVTINTDFKRKMKYQNMSLRLGVARGRVSPSRPLRQVKSQPE